jgi:hypothetical protein
VGIHQNKQSRQLLWFPYGEYAAGNQALIDSVMPFPLEKKWKAIMTVPYLKHANNFTIIGNACFNDDRLSFEALAIFTYLRSKPADWVVRPNEIATRFKAGRDRVRKALNQLVECGYVGKVQTRDPETGRMGPVDYVVRALPEGVADAPIASLVPSTETPSTENPSTVIRSLLSTDSLPSTDSTKEDNIRSTACAVPPSELNRRDALQEESKESGDVGTRIGQRRSSNEERSPRRYRQSPAEAACAWNELRQLEGWGGIWGDGEMDHWHALLRKGYAADDIADFAERFLRQTHEAPSLGDFLAGFDCYRKEAA